LDEVLLGSPLSYLVYRDYAIIIGDRDRIKTTFSTEYFHALEESLNISEIEMAEVTIGSLETVDQRGETIVDGRVTDAETGEEIIGATVVVKETETGSITDETGYFTVAVSPGTHTFSVQYVGYQNKEFSCKVISSGFI